ncbi:hypothetical protein Pmani_000060 [Petrolisthes manimaculis]|uniref:Uncharacterized protein n=1 Tax=Petrolisthes manimaculis TaxID=1843537 RepID=A0AAE1UT42_9EUCA|nr:hypothetical protein Pmani_000060 [Petrolisthes manimaculis]
MRTISLPSGFLGAADVHTSSFQNFYNFICSSTHATHIYTSESDAVWGARPFPVRFCSIRLAFSMFWTCHIWEKKWLARETPSPGGPVPDCPGSPHRHFSHVLEHTGRDPGASTHPTGTSRRDALRARTRHYDWPGIIHLVIGQPPEALPSGSGPCTTRRKVPVWRNTMHCTLWILSARTAPMTPGLGPGGAPLEPVAAIRLVWTLQSREVPPQYCPTMWTKLMAGPPCLVMD